MLSKEDAREEEEDLVVEVGAAVGVDDVVLRYRDDEERKQQLEEDEDHEDLANAVDAVGELDELARDREDLEADAVGRAWNKAVGFATTVNSPISRAA